MASVARALARIKEDLAPHLPPAAIESACRAAGHAWRARKLGPVETVHLFVLQVLHGNTAIRHLRHLAGDAAGNAAAYCRARMRLPAAVLQDLLRASSASLRESLGGPRGGGGGGDPTRWRGHRTLLLDGTGTAVPDTPQLRRVFRRPVGHG